jgi:hypothetical protein
MPTVFREQVNASRRQFMLGKFGELERRRRCQTLKGRVERFNVLTESLVHRLSVAVSLLTGRATDGP